MEYSIEKDLQKLAAETNCAIVAVDSVGNNYKQWKKTTVNEHRISSVAVDSHGKIVNRIRDCDIKKRTVKLRFDRNITLDVK